MPQFFTKEKKNVLLHCAINALAHQCAIDA